MTAKHPPEATPFPNSYWVIAGKLLAGEYPGSKYFEDETRHKLHRLIEVGVNLFIDLTSPEDINSYLPILEEEAGWLDEEIEYRRFQIPDFSIPAEEEMMCILDTIDAALDAGKMVYVHCWAGIGRTGTVIGCYLVQHGMSGEAALERIAELRDGIPISWTRSPESSAQWTMVTNWQVGE